MRDIARVLVGYITLMICVYAGGVCLILQGLRVVLNYLCMYQLCDWAARNSAHAERKAS